MAGALGVLPYTHLEGEQHERAASAKTPIVVARVSLKGGAAAAARRRGPTTTSGGSAALVAVATALVVVAVAALGSGGAFPAFSSSSLIGHNDVSSSPPPPRPILPPLPGNAPNCFSGGGDCARGLLLPLPSPSSSSPSSPSTSSLLDLIPKVVHLTVEDRTKIPCHMFPTMKSWQNKNPGWRLWVWDAKDRARLISEAFPKWRSFFEALPNGVERADLFKYAVLSSIGGAYADIDADCKVPIEEWPGIYQRALMLKSEKNGNTTSGGGRKISAAATAPPSPPSSALILGIEAMHDDADTYAQAKHVYPLQLSAWTVLASPNHPALGPKGDSLFPASQAEAARELLGLFSEQQQGKSSLQVLKALGVRGGFGDGSGGDFDDDGDDENDGSGNNNNNNNPSSKLLDASARLWYRESILNRTGPFLLTREALKFASEKLDFQIDTHEDAKRLLRNDDGFVGVAAAAGSSSPSSSSSSSSSAAAITILPLDAFGSGQPHSRAGPADGEQALVVHRFLSSWRGSGDGQDEDYWCEWKG